MCLPESLHPLFCFGVPRERERKREVKPMKICHWETNIAIRPEAPQEEMLPLSRKKEKAGENSQFKYFLILLILPGVCKRLHLWIDASKCIEDLFQASVKCHDKWVSCEQRKSHHIKSLNTTQERWQIIESSFQLKKPKEDSYPETFWKEKKRFTCKGCKGNRPQKGSFSTEHIIIWIICTIIKVIKNEYNATVFGMGLSLSLQNAVDWPFSFLWLPDALQQQPSGNLEKIKIFYLQDLELHNTSGALEWGRKQRERKHTGQACCFHWVFEVGT